ncbi:hypothetical protein AGABI1DRAFT_130577 [Agaricus bisporus var. burnettii JB137-S8]|uniref:Uncharacterized protein n=1 Tax=Agaricus bisporus var. burnettii (strain JB137-S8 / ATCC MYA-4627 / FGSC 10392) TaxID=597362 RepID=K5XQS7_AGABU|nr:uncharacterized protein AGABI1DRAFT_130577 [Agaricus bisporus var. burnettii JB137-S8]EKM77160.1 hypothetical protein AGABI1DRAFT_130577 [Agaricus bisporus var. burnettii JB137-S8]
MFEDEEVRRSCLMEYIPIDSTEACADVERFLRSSFKVVQKKYRHRVYSNWPSNADFLKLTAAASGLFIYAEVVMQFIRDSDRADPVSQLKILISVIDRSTDVPTKENPFVHLDALYKEILSSIPLTLWPTTKQILGGAIYGGRIAFGWYGHNLHHNFQTLRGMSILFDVTRNSVYASLDKSRSTLKIPDWKVAHKKPLTFFHASFADYLKESSRSGDFHVGSEEDVKKEMILRLLEIWHKCSGDDIAISSVESTWRQYCSELDDKSPSWGIKGFYTSLFHNTMSHLTQTVSDILYEPMESPAVTSLRKVHMRKLCYFSKMEDVRGTVLSMMSITPQPWHVGLRREVQLGDLGFGHLDWKEMSPVSTHFKDIREYSSGIIHRPRSNAELQVFVSDLESLQKHSPELRVDIVGGVPKERVALFQRDLTMYYIVPYPE